MAHRPVGWSLACLSHVAIVSRLEDCGGLDDVRE